MSFDVIRFLEKHNIGYDDSGSQVTAGWVNVQCPFCQDPSRHCGLNEDGACSCWHCGKHDLLRFIMRILRVDREAALRVRREYGHGKTHRKPRLSKAQKQHAESCVLPDGCGPLNDRHRAYLHNRNFDPEMLEAEWDLEGTGHLGNYKFRIIAPIYIGEELVSYQGRDITGRSELKYKACPERLEVVHHKHILYGAWKGTLDRVVVVEGITDVWRLGPGACATFGSKWTSRQRAALSLYTNVHILFDSSDDNAMSSAEKLAEQLSMIVPFVEIVETDWDDPGSAPDDEARSLMKELGFSFDNKL